MNGSGRASRSRKERLVFIASILALVLLVDLLLDLALPSPYAAPPAELETLEDVRRYLTHVSEAPGPWLLLGDSVLVGRVIASEVEDWKRHRIVQYLERSKSPTSEATFHQIALDGLLPADFDGIVAELNRLDPSGRVSVVIELNPRYFSRAYAGSAAGSREWLHALDEEEATRDVLARHLASGRQWIADHLPVFRHRFLLETRLSVRVSELVTTRARASADPLSSIARVLEHYRELDLTADSAQVAAFQKTLELLARTNRRAVLFTTPIEDEFLSDAMSERAYGDYIAGLEEWISGRSHQARLVNLDAPVFTRELFFDHCHLLPEGNRILALNLLRELNIGLDRMPDRFEMIYPEEADRTIVWQVDRGYADGAGWQAKFDSPRALAVDDEGRVVIADTNNHCLREVLPNGLTVRTIAGSPGRPGSLDGPAASATMTRPTAVATIAGEVFVAERRGLRLRRIKDGATSTVTPQGEAWRRIERIRGFDGKLYLLDDGSRILEYDPATSATRIALRGTEGERIKAFDISPRGELFFADGDNRIWRSRVAEEEQRELVFSNLGSVYLPTGDTRYPLAFDELKLTDVLDLHYVVRYEGLLVQDDNPPMTPSRAPTETVHLRFLSLADRLVYPWLKPIVAGNAYITRNARSQSYVSLFHRGVMAIHQPTASVLYLEAERPRLFRINDGLWGAARIGHSPFVDLEIGGEKSDPFGIRLGETVFANFRPDRFFDRREERLPRAGPFIGAFLGSSYTVTSDVASQYSLGRSVEARLGERLGYRNGIRYEQLSRIRTGLRFEEAVELFEEHVAQGVKLDAMFLSLDAPPRIEDDEYLPYLERLRIAAELYDTKVILLDNSGLGELYREGLRPTEPSTTRLLEIARAVGFTTVELTGTLLNEYLRVAPWGSIPFASNHASPWAIDRTAELIAERTYLVLSQHFEGRLPAFRRPTRALGEPADPDTYLSQAFANTANDWPSRVRHVDASSVQRRFRAGHLTLYVDLRQAALAADPTSLELREQAVSVLYRYLVQDRAGSTATGVALTLATFGSYDEYGQGVLDDAVPLLEETFDNRTDLESFLIAHLSGH